MSFYEKIYDSYLPEELAYVPQLINDYKIEEALHIIAEFEKREDITPEERLGCQLYRANIYSNAQRYEESNKTAEKVYLLASKRDNYQITVDSLYGLICTFHFLGRLDEESEAIGQYEKFLNLISGVPYPEIALRKAFLLSMKGWYYFFMGKIDDALEYAFQSLELNKKFGNDIDIGLNYYQIISHFKSKGELNKALEYEKPVLSLDRHQLGTRANFSAILVQLGEVYANKGQLDQALKYYDQVLELEKEERLINPNFSRRFGFTVGSFRIGNLYRLKGDFDQALNYLNNFLKFAETTRQKYFITQSLFWLIIMNLEKKSLAQAQNYLKRLEMVVENVKSPLISQIYRIAKALILKSSTRSIHKGEAEKILKEIAEEGVTYHEINTIALISLCDLLLMELRTSNDMSILEEINPYISILLNDAENQQSYRWIAEINLLKAKISQIKLNLDDARKFLTKAQKIASEHGLQLLAQKISLEHDKLLEELETWQVFRDTQASLSKRMKLTPVDGVIERLLYKQTIEPPELVDEEPILLLIMGRDGISYFNHPFVENWNFDDIFSSFMSAFNTVMDEIFSKSIDRIRVGENTILINPVESFLVCYVIRGQSFSALQKLSRFSDAIKWKTEIWDTLNRSIKTSEMLELNNPPSLGEVVNEIFNQ
jgi:tetratricopeptide (TPR) repeat protein